MTIPHRVAILGHILKEHQSVSTQSQQQRLSLALTYLGNITTIEARDYLDIMHPSGRIKELKKQGWLIISSRVRHIAPCGASHFIANYVLQTLPLARAA